MGKADAVKRECGECGYKWHTSPNTFQYNPACPRCGAAHPDLTEERDAREPKAEAVVESAPSASPEVVVLQPYETPPE
jgi:ribosomal protein S27AE